jgi:hypothetical protein
MMEAARTSETLVNFYQTTRRYNSEDSDFRTHRRENLKSYYRNHLYQDSKTQDSFYWLGAFVPAISSPK